MSQLMAVPVRKPYLMIRPPSGWAALNLRELWQFRDLLFTLAGRDVKLRYRQTLLGVIWVVLQPLLGAGVMTIVFGMIAKLQTSGVPAFVFSFAGMLGWNAFNTTLSKAGLSLVGNAHLVSKVYFPRLALPLSTVLSTLLDFAVGLVVMIVLLICYRIAPGRQVLLLPVWLLLVLILGTGLGLWTSALSVQYRDVQYVMPVVLTLLQFVSPIGYSVQGNVKGRLLQWYMLNPLAGLLEGFHWSLLGRGEVHWGYVAYAAIIAGITFLAGAAAFKRMERRFADII